MGREVCLTSKGLSRIRDEKDFVLTTDNRSDPIVCSRSQISFISPIVSNLFLSDPTINEFALVTANSSTCTDYIRSLLGGSSVTIADDDILTFHSISLELGNEELFIPLEEGITAKNAVSLFKIKENLHLNNDAELKFISSHFYEISIKDILSLEVSVLDRVLSSDSLVIKSEHWLFDLIRQLIEDHGSDYHILLSHLHLEYLSMSDISAFLEYVNEDNVSNFYSCISRRLLCPLADIKEEKKRHKAILVSYNGDKFEGIFSLLPVSKGIVSIEMTSLHGGYNIPFLVDPSKRNQADWFCSTSYNDREPAYIIDFKDKVVSLNGYSLKAHSSRFSTSNFIKSWKVEGSNDKVTWDVIDEQRDSTSLLSNMSEGNWQFILSEPYRFFRIKMTSRNTDHQNYYMTLQAIEFFGLIYCA